MVKLPLRGTVFQGVQKIKLVENAQDLKKPVLSKLELSRLRKR